MDDVVKKAQATEMANATQPVYDDFPFSKRSLLCLDQNNPIRKKVADVVRHRYFDQASMIVIVVNCIFLCFTDPLDQDPNSSRNKILNGSEVYFTAIFTIEMIFKIVGMGFCRAKGKYLPAAAEEILRDDPQLEKKDFLKKRLSYLGDYWNWLDFTVVLIGYLSYIPGVDNVSALRTFRVLRPLKTLSSFPGMRIITTAMIDSLGELANVMMLCVFFFFVMGIVGVQMYNGAADGQCFISHNATHRPLNWQEALYQDSFDSENCAMTDKRDWPENVRDVLLIGEGDGRACAPIVMDENTTIYRHCGRVTTGSGPDGGYGPSYGTGSFDNIGLAVLSIFTAITLEGWVDEMYMLFNGFGLKWFTAIYYVLLILLGAFFMLQLALAVIENAMTNATEDEAAAAAEEAAAEAANGENVPEVEAVEEITADKKKPGIKFFRDIVEHKVFEGVIVVAIFANTIVLAMEYHSTDPESYADYQKGLDVCNYIFTAIFFIEMVFKLLGLYRKEYFSDGFNCFDFLIVMVSLVELVIELAKLTEGGSGLSALRAFRLFRMFKLAKSWAALYKLLITIQESVMGVGNATVLLMVMIFIFILLGMQLFGEAMSKGENYGCGGGDDSCVPRANFSTFLWSFVTVFQVLTGENWNEVLYNGILATNFGLGVIYFVLLNLVGNYIILNIFMAILLGNFGGDDEEEEADADSPANKVKNNKVLPTSENGSGTAVTTKSESEPEKLTNVSVIDLTKRKAAPKKKKESEFQLNGDAFFILGKDSAIRKATFTFITWPPFDNFILLLIAISSLLLALDEPHLDPHSSMKKALEVLDRIITILFIMEATIKIITFGFVGHKHAYLRNNWNQLDFSLVCLSIIGLIGLGDQVKSLKSLRALRALRPLRVLNRAPGMKLVVNSIFKALPHIFNVVVVCMLFYLIFGIIGVQNWAGGMNVCNNPVKICKPGIPIFDSHPDLACDGKCTAEVNFPKGLGCNDISVTCGWAEDPTPVPEDRMFKTGGLKDNGAWQLESDEFIASCTKDQQEGEVCTCGILGTNDLIDACMARAYCEFGTSTYEYKSEGGSFIAPQVNNVDFCQIPEDKRWDFEKFKLKEVWEPLPQHFDNVGNALMSVFEISSGEMWPDIMYTVIDVVGKDQPMSVNYNKVVALYFIAVQIVCAFLLLNLFVGVVIEQYQAMKDGQDGDGPLMTEEQKMWIETQKLAFSAGPVRKVKRPEMKARAYFFDIVESREFEMVIMACIMLNVVTMAMRKFNQSDEYQNALEIMNLIFVAIFTVEAAAKIFALGWCEYWVRNWNKFDFTIVILSFVGMAFDLGQFATLLRVGRVARMFRLVQTNKNLRDLFYTLIFSLPSISNVASVTFLLFFIYAAFGMNIFANVKYGDNLTDKANFNTFFDSILLLFRMATGESYNGVMHDVRVQEPFCSEAEGNCGLPAFAPFYFLSFFIFSALMMLNMLVAIILGEYSDQEEQGHLYERVSPDSIEDFTKEWTEFDPKATGFMPLVKLEKLIMKLPVPLGTRKYVTDDNGNSEKAKVDEWQDRKPARKKMAKLQCIERNGKVSFHEVLSGLVANAHADIDLAGLASNPQWTDDLMAQTRNGPAHKFIRRAEKESHRPDAARNVNGDPFTVEECTAAMMMQNAWRRHQSVKQQAWKDRQKQVAKQQEGRDANMES